MIKIKYLKLVFLRDILGVTKIYYIVYFTGKFFVIKIMLLSLLLLIPLVALLIISIALSEELTFKKINFTKIIALVSSILNLFISLVVFIFFDFSSDLFQFVQEYLQIGSFDMYLGVDGVSIYFVLLTTIIMPISLLSNWTSISENAMIYVIIILLLETLLLASFLVLNVFLFYIFFESILAPLFILIGLFGSSNKVRASFYLFLYTLLGSLFLLLSILTMSSMMGTTDYDGLYKTNFNYYTQLFLFCGIFTAFAVKTPTIFLNIWLLRAHVESPLGGSIILASIVLKLSVYGILRLILSLLPKASLDYTYIVYMIGVITIIYASISTLRTIDVKELIAYSSVSHAAVYIIGVFSNRIQGIEGSIVLGLAHGFVSSGLFICAGGILYDRSSTRLITFYRGVTQLMPIFSILFLILCLSNAGTPLSLNFIGEFLSIYGAFERLPLLGIFASSSIVLSAAYTMFMFNRIAFGGTFTKYFKVNLPDISQREFILLIPLVIFTVFLGVYPSIILDGIHYSVSCLIYENSYDSLINLSLFSFIFKKNNIFKSNFVQVLFISILFSLALRSPMNFFCQQLGFFIFYCVWSGIAECFKCLLLSNLDYIKSLNSRSLLIKFVIAFCIIIVFPYIFGLTILVLFDIFELGYLFMNPSSSGPGRTLLPKPSSPEGGGTSGPNPPNNNPGLYGLGNTSDPFHSQSSTGGNTPDPSEDLQYAKSLSVRHGVADPEEITGERSPDAPYTRSTYFYESGTNLKEYYWQQKHDGDLKVQKLVDVTPDGKQFKLDPPLTIPSRPINVEKLYVNHLCTKPYDPSSRFHLGKRLFIKGEDGKVIPYVITPTQCTVKIEKHN